MLTHSSLGKVAFIGIGLIGGSLALALRRANIVDEILAIDASKAALAEALALGVIDRAVDWEDLSEADIIVLSTPVDALYTVCQSLAQISLKETVVITDVGSTKGSVLDAIRQAFGDIPDNFVPAHPIAGREKSGVAAADATLFQRHKVILTTLDNTDNRALGIVSRIWHAAGALISYLSIDAHDEILGATSHLPHVLAYLLVDMLDQDLHHEEIFTYAAGGFRDFTRIASSSPVMWRDICVHNPNVLRRLLTQYRRRIEAFETLLAEGNGDDIETIFSRAKRARDTHYQKEQQS
ncbi:prephenate dehydrogenase [Suttonella ornithocola]|uniref:Arogenate dehydrogenase n=1 Tax=Suttonella ornithocola TaxID=279832 RepID=A0A380MR22_9GAMM|nr:prephenate dehydrogenase/arogenate dehydrogenase family protein [Suttonella ornithocola]SUO94762.1 Arogenate dehydrogenase [Suttonella ornithocola]